MNHKGLTIIELIAILVILGIIAGIGFASIGDTIQSQRKRAILNDALAIEHVARFYCETEGCSIGDTLTTTELSEYISNIKNGYTYEVQVLEGFGYAVTFIKEGSLSFPVNANGEIIDGLIPSRASEIYVNKSETSPVVTTSSIPIGSPYVLLSGDATVYVEIASFYDDPGAIAYTSLGEEISSTWTQGTVNFWALGTYERSYHAYSSYDQENCIPATRYIIVVDTTPPVININGSDLFYVERGTYYSDWGAWAQDNSNESVSVEVSGLDSVDIYTLGTYYITYTAEDSSGNVATATRTVIVR